MVERTDRMSELLAHAAAEFIRDEANTSPLITVTKVTIARDFKQATVFVSVYPDTQEDEAIIFLTRKGTDFRNYLKTHARLKTIPFFDFKIDYGEKNRQSVDGVANRLD